MIFATDVRNHAPRGAASPVVLLQLGEQWVTGSRKHGLVKPKIMAKFFDRMALVVKASVDTGQDGVKFAAYRDRPFGARRIDKSGHVHLYKRTIIISFR